MPRKCECNKCERFRENMPEGRLTNASIKALDALNAPSTKSRRARIKAGVGKSGVIKDGEE